jgi:hypothetical protein
MKLKLTIALCALTAGCATTPATPPAPAPLDPVGVYDFTTEVDGTAVTGTITITSAATGYGGSIDTNVSETMPVRSVTVAGRKVTVLADAPDGPVTFVLDLDGDDFGGTWTYAGMSGTHSGKRRGT